VLAGLFTVMPVRISFSLSTSYALNQRLKVKVRENITAITVKTLTARYALPFCDSNEYRGATRRFMESRKMK
jgi:hypothetical protein